MAGLLNESERALHTYEKLKNLDKMPKLHAQT